MQLSDRIGRRMKLHDLHVLMAVAQAGSMSRAAQLLNTTQPAISKSIADLEHAIGVRLLDRGRQGAEPTEYGRALLDGGVAVFDDLRQAVREHRVLDQSHGRRNQDHRRTTLFSSACCRRCSAGSAGNIRASPST